MDAGVVVAGEAGSSSEESTVVKMTTAKTTPAMPITASWTIGFSFSAWRISPPRLRWRAHRSAGAGG